MYVKKLALASAIGLLCGGAAQAEPLTWNEIGIGYNKADSGDEEADALDILASLGFGSMFHGQLQYVDGSVDGGEGESDFDFDGYEARLGLHPSVGENSQVIIDVIYFDYEGDDGFNNGEEDGYGLGFGLRHQIGEQFEIRADINYYDGDFEASSPFGSFSEDFTNTSYRFGGRYYFNPAIFAGVSIEVNGSEAFSIAESGDVIRLTAGWSFGQGLTK
jgi:hypothetical protein